MRTLRLPRLQARRLWGPHHRVPAQPRLVKLYSRTADVLRPQADPNFMNGVYLSGAGGLFSTAEDYAQFAMMLANNGELNGKRYPSPRVVELMGSLFAPDTLPGRAARASA